LAFGAEYCLGQDREKCLFARLTPLGDDQHKDE
jgi:hypothetical protein